MPKDMNVEAEKLVCGCQFDTRMFDELLSEAVEVVVFGSRAAGVHRSSSDLDLLVVGSQRRRIFASGLDCVLLTPEEVINSFWLGSELASHVAKYGLWIKGTGEWSSKVRLTDRAISRKRKRISSLLRNAIQRWPRIHSVFQLKYKTTLRRELQRLKLLEGGFPIPPTPLLDSEWRVESPSRHQLLDMAMSLGLQKLTDHEANLELRNSLLGL